MYLVIERNCVPYYYFFLVIQVPGYLSGQRGRESPRSEVNPQTDARLPGAVPCVIAQCTVGHRQ